MKPDLIDEIITSVQAALPPGLSAAGDDLREHLRSQLQALFTAQGLVTQESFEVQQQVLLRTREKLEALEERVKALEG